MNRVLLAGIAAVATAVIVWAILDRTYRYDIFASEKARTSLEVTEAQSAELIASRRYSDILAYGIFGSVLAFTCSIVMAKKPRPIGLIALAPVLGFVGGALGGLLAHVQDTQMAFVPNQITYWVARWSAIMVPIGLACGLAAQITNKSKGFNGIVGGVIGALAAAIVYSGLSGSITSIENRQDVFPIASGNRLLALLATAVCVSLLVALQIDKPVKEKLKKS